jgi:hypothetical protein
MPAPKRSVANRPAPRRPSRRQIGRLFSSRGRAVRGRNSGAETVCPLATLEVRSGATCLRVICVVLPSNPRMCPALGCRLPNFFSVGVRACEPRSRPTAPGLQYVRLFRRTLHFQHAGDVITRAQSLPEHSANVPKQNDLRSVTNSASTSRLLPRTHFISDQTQHLWASAAIVADRD